MKKSLLIILATSCYSILVMAQNTEAIWLSSINRFTISPKVSIHFDALWCSGDAFNNTRTMLFRPGLSYNFSKSLSVTAGYVYSTNRRTINEVSGYAPENRIWQQLGYIHSLGIASFRQRVRLEERFISKSFVEYGKFQNEGYVYANRLSYFLKTVIPFNGHKTFTKGLFGAAQDEIMLNIGDNSGVNNKFFDQNRVYLAIGYRFSEKFDLEAGYMDQYIQYKSKSFANNHVIQLVTFTRL